MEFQHSCTYKNELSLMEPLLKEENKADDDEKDDEKSPHGPIQRKEEKSHSKSDASKLRRLPRPVNDVNKEVCLATVTEVKSSDEEINLQLETPTSFLYKPISLNYFCTRCYFSVFLLEINFIQSAKIGQLEYIMTKLALHTHRILLPNCCVAIQ